MRLLDFLPCRYLSRCTYTFSFPASASHSLSGLLARPFFNASQLALLRNQVSDSPRVRGGLNIWLTLFVQGPGLGSRAYILNSQECPHIMVRTRARHVTNQITCACVIGSCHAPQGPARTHPTLAAASVGSTSPRAARRRPAMTWVLSVATAASRTLRCIYAPLLPRSAHFVHRSTALPCVVVGPCTLTYVLLRYRVSGMHAERNT